MGFPGYFLVTADLCRYAKQTGIRVGPGRGSAAGSLVAYALRITDLDPIKHKLLFERFLNPERISMPDIDLDFDERRRGDMIRYATEKYGEERVSQIITYGTIKAKAAVKDAARVLGFPYAVGDKITKAMPPAVMGKDIPLSGIFDPSHKRYGEAGEFRALYESDPEAKQVVDTARGLEGLKRQWGVHAAGVILCREPLLDVIPIHRREQDGAIITQFDMGACETLGLLKMDFLGLRNLTVLDDCLKHITANRGETVVLEELDEMQSDPKTYELLARGDTLGVFQLDGGPMRSLLRSMQPDRFESISAVLALYRPGPMGVNAHNDYADRKTGRKPVVPIHPELGEALEEILGDTYGLIVYQEQVMAIAQQLAGYTLGAADLLRRAMGKKKREILDKEYIPFSDGMKANGYSEAAIKTLWDTLVPFADYAFNRAHTAGYGLVSFWTAYLKANYPAEYMAALLTSVKDDKDKSALYLAECRRMGIKVLPPDVNDSDSDFTPRGTDIRFGLSAIRNVGTNVVASIVRTREAKGRFADFSDFLRKVEAVACNKKTVESLCKAGAFDSLGHSRKGLVAVHAEAIDACMDTKRNEAIGQFDLFGGGDDDGAGDGGHLRRRRADGGVGQVGPAHLRARDARALRLRPPAVRRRARAGRRGRPAGVRAGRVRRRPHRRRRRHPVQRHPQDDQAGQPLGAGHARGPRGRRRGDVLPAELRQRRRPPRRGRRGARPRARRQARGRPEDHRQRDHGARPVGRSARSGGRVAADAALHPAGRRAVQGGAVLPPRHDRRAPAARRRRADDRGPARRRAARAGDAGAVRRPQGAARHGLPADRRLSRTATRSSALGAVPASGGSSPHAGGTTAASCTASHRSGRNPHRPLRTRHRC